MDFVPLRSHLPSNLWHNVRAWVASFTSDSGASHKTTDHHAPEELAGPSPATSASKALNCPYKCCRPSTEAQPVSPLQCHDGDPPYYCYVDWSGKAFTVHWSGDVDHPDLSRFPVVDNASVKAVETSSDIALLWAASTPVDFGAQACVRCTHEEPFPIIKLAPFSERGCAMMKHEFEILGQMSKYDLPIPKFSPEPLIDADGLYGYRMEALERTTTSKWGSYAPEIKLLVERMHQQGFAHGDLLPNNAMKNQQGDLVLIDFTFSGVLGTAIPDHIPREVFHSDVFHAQADEDMLRLFYVGTPTTPPLVDNELYRHG